MRWGRSPSSGKRNDKTVLEVNDRCHLHGIPPEAHSYQVSGRSPLEWAVTSLKVKHDKTSGIVDDPNGWHVWADEPWELIRHLKRLAFIGVRSAEIIAGCRCRCPILPRTKQQRSDREPSQQTVP